jgi:hypothetical protein
MAPGVRKVGESNGRLAPTVGLTGDLAVKLSTAGVFGLHGRSAVR